MGACDKRIVIYLGGDDLVNATEESFKAGYSQLINSLRSASSETKIICCSIASVSSAYPGTDGLNKDLIATANGWIRDVSIQNGVYFAFEFLLLKNS